MKIALVHEFLTQLGGAERVLEAFHELFPDAPVFTIVHDPEKTEQRYRDWDIRTSFVQRMPGGVRHYQYFLPLMPRAVETFPLDEFDVVLSDSSAFAKGARTRLNTVHISYCHTPTRYLWESLDQYVDSGKHPKVLKMAVKPWLKHYLKRWDYQAAQRPHHLIANSQTVMSRIRRYYDRDADVIYPPVDTDFFQPITRNKEEYYFIASRLEPYKQVGLAIEAFGQLGLPLRVAGTGTDIYKLRSLAKGNIEFLGRVSDAELRALYSHARGFVFPSLEDAGIVVLESLASGTPVIGLNKGGTAEYIQDGVQGVLFENQTAADIVAAVKRFKKMDFSPDKLRQHALRFDKQVFKRKIREYIDAHRD